MASTAVKCIKTPHLLLVYTISTKMKMGKMLCNNHKKYRKKWEKRTKERNYAKKFRNFFRRYNEIAQKRLTEFSFLL